MVSAESGMFQVTVFKLPSDLGDPPNNHFHFPFFLSYETFQAVRSSSRLGSSQIQDELWWVCESHWSHLPGQVPGLGMDMDTRGTRGVPSRKVCLQA